MKRLACAVLALAVVAAPGLTTVPALAQTKMDCSRLYKDFWEKFDRERYAKIPAEQLAGVSRLALCEQLNQEGLPWYAYAPHIDYLKNG